MDTLQQEFTATLSKNHEQEQQLAEVAQTLVNLDESVQQNAAMTEETSAASATLRQTASSLKEQISKFLLN
jgi:methyl-accepting chemotaxis protein